MNSNRVAHITFVFALILLAEMRSPGKSTLRAAELDFRRDIQPILSEHCLHCHGADDQTRHGGLRLDRAAEAIKGGESGHAAIVPGKSDASEVLRRILSTDSDSVMPPPAEKKPLTAKQIEQLKTWIDEGAAYANHWAFEPIASEPLPNNGPSHPIDQFVKRELVKRKLEPAPRETDSVLCRRLYLDIIGIPPTPEEVQRFYRNGYEATVDELLASERYGEKWARHWLDVARYSDTNGYEKDLRRDQWAWRDWVVQALNADMPYDQFLIEQIAGDLLPNATQSQVVATGFLRNSMLNEEGAIVPEQFRMFEMFDRMDCLGKAVLGLTTQCAQCHNHKFDPLTQDEYYGLFSFLNNSYEAQSWVYTDQQQAKKKEVEAKVNSIYEQAKKDHPDWAKELRSWEDGLSRQQVTWTPVPMHQLESKSGLNHPVQLGDSSILMLGHTSGDVFFVGPPSLPKMTSFQLEILNHDDLPFRGPGRSNVGTWDISEVELYTQASDKSEWIKQKLAKATADFSEPEKKNDKKSSGPVSNLIDGSDDTSWQADRGIGLRNQPSVAVIQLEQPLELPSGTKLKFVMRMGKMVGCCRISLTDMPNAVAAEVDYRAILAVRKGIEGQDDQDRIAVLDAWIRSLQGSPNYAEQLAKAWKDFPNAMTSVLHLRERGGSSKRVTHRLNRGEWDQPVRPIEPHTPAFLHANSKTANPSRLDLAKWLASKDSPLTARVEANRVWQAIFGDGIVETAEDFGTRTPIPEQLSVLNWLSAELIQSGWSQKKLIKTIVLSDTYRQSSKVTSTHLEQDPRNRYLSRGPRFRCEAEVVRDIALAVSGLLTHRVGGPSVIPPVPQNVLDYNYVVPGYWTPAQGPERYRRSLYVFRKRSMPDPVMSNLDSPNGDMACARRVRSNTPLAALTGLNETIFVESAQAMAIRVLREGGTSDASRIDYAYQLCTARLPSREEQAAMLEFLQQSRKRISDGWLSVREITTGDASKLPSIPDGTTPQDAAAWTLAARVLLNLDETISKN